VQRLDGYRALRYRRTLKIDYKIIIGLIAYIVADEMDCHGSNEDDKVLIQRHVRESPANSFNRSWEEFKNGFCDSYGNFWVGNDRLRRMSHDHHRKKLHVYLTNLDGDVSFLPTQLNYLICASSWELWAPIRFLPIYDTIGEFNANSKATSNGVKDP